MQADSSTGEIRIVGADTEGHQVSFDILAQVLSGLQRTAYVLAAARQQQTWSQRFTPSEAIKRQATLRAGLPQPGSYALPIEFAPAREDLFEPLNLLEELRQVFTAIAEDRRAALDSVLPDGRYRERTLREITRFLPKPGAAWGLWYQHGDNPPVTLDARHTRQLEHWLTPEAPGHSNLTVTGELIRVDFEQNLLTLRYPPTQRELHCSYVQEIGDTLIESRRELIQVTGRFTLDAEGNPLRMSEVTRIEPVDLSPLSFPTLEQAGRCLRFDPALHLTPYLDEDTQQLLVVSDASLDIHAYAQTREQLTDELAAQVFFLWDEYAQAEPDTLTEGAQSLRDALLSRCQEAASHAA